MRKLEEPATQDCVDNKLILEFDFDHVSYEIIHQYIFGLKVTFNVENTLYYYEISSMLEVDSLEELFRKEILSEKFINNEKWFNIYLLQLKLNDKYKNIILEELMRFISINEFTPLLFLIKDQHRLFRENDFVYFLSKSNEESVNILNKSFQNKIRAIDNYCRALNKNKEYIESILESIFKIKQIKDIHSINYLEKEMNIRIIEEDKKIELLLDLNKELIINNEILKTCIKEINVKMTDLMEKFKSSSIECVILREKLTEFLEKNLLDKQPVINVIIEENLRNSNYNTQEFCIVKNSVSRISEGKYAYFVFDYYLKNNESFNIKYKLVAGFEKWAFFGIGLKNKIRNGIWESSLPDIYGITQHGYSKFHTNQLSQNTSSKYYLNENLMLKNDYILEVKYNGENSYIMNLYNDNSNLIGSEDFTVIIKDSEKWCPLFIFYNEGQKVDVIEFKLNI